MLEKIKENPFKGITAFIALIGLFMQLFTFSTGENGLQKEKRIEQMSDHQKAILKLSITKLNNHE